MPALERYVDVLAELWESRMLSNFATYCQRLEAAVAKQLGMAHVLAVSSADTGLMAVLRALDLPEGAPCFVPDFTFPSTVNAPLWNGLTPHLVDIDGDTFNIDPEALAVAMHRAPGRGVVVATHVFGNPCDVESVVDVARENDAYVVFDAAHALGSLRNGTPVGGFGDAEVFSLSGTKPVTSGEGGVVSTRLDWLAERLELVREYGFGDDYDVKWIGLNGKMSELHAALGVLNFGYLHQILGRREEIYLRYREQLGTHVTWQLVRSVDRSTHTAVCLRLGAQRDFVEDALE